ncbi:MAG: VaFE repeat-containing surface-anchored protein [Lachnospiraceae bacterium]|nr:VaFE repeat-containing surface-anchored protein [Lachnospiraceae bacterium]
MRIKRKAFIAICLIMTIIMVAVGVQNLVAQAQGSIDDENISLYTLGDEGETILVRGLKATVGDFGDVIGYERTSPYGGYVEYRDNVHHSMVVTTSRGMTEGYCMQPYVNGPGNNAFVDYNYIEGLQNSSIFNGMSAYEQNRWLTTYVIATKYAFGGTNADPNWKDGRNPHDGGTYGTYIIEKNGKPTVVYGLMIGGKVYEMTSDEARALTQVIVHYVGNRISDKTITDFRGFTNPVETSAAFNHLKLYADSGRTQYDTGKTITESCAVFDQEDVASASWRFDWYVYNFSTNSWESFSGKKLNEKYLSENGTVKLKVDYTSKYMCNKLMKNSDTEYVKVKHNYEPFVVSGLDSNPAYYDYFTVGTDAGNAVTVTYDMVSAGKKNYTNGWLWGHSYEVDTFGQSAVIEVDGEKLIASEDGITINVRTGDGSYAARSYNSADGTFGTRMYSCPQVQDCLFLASNSVVSGSSSVGVDIELTGAISLNKISARTDMTGDNSCYDMTGAEYKVYAVSSNKDTAKSKHIGTFSTDSNGNGKVIWNNYNANSVGAKELDKLPFGWYMVCEEKAPSNGSYLIDTKKYYVHINNSNYKTVQTVKSSEEPAADPIPFEIVKVSSEGKNLGGGSLEGAEFTVYYYKGYYDSYKQISEKKVEADREWTFSTRVINSTNNATCIIHKDLLVEGSDELFLDERGNAVLPLGTIVVKETKPPVGYTLDGVKYNIVDTMDGTATPLDGPYTSKININEGTIKLQAGNKVLVEEKAIRGDLSFVKVDKHTGKPMAGIPFSITSKTTGESHIIVTDENGVASTSASHILHSKDTNGNDNITENSKNLKPTGIWFNGFVDEQPATDSDAEGVYNSLNDKNGALPYDTYIVRELSCSANKGYVLAKEWEVVINKDRSNKDYGKIENSHEPKVSTDVFDAQDKDKKVWLDRKISIVDYVEYSYLEPGRKYILKGTVMNKATGEVMKSKDKEITTSVEFTPSKHDGMVEVPFEFELGCCKGDKLVIFEYLYDAETMELVAKHTDINCDKQTITLEVEATTEVTTEMTTEVTTELTTEATTVTTTELTTTENTTEATTEETGVKGVQTPKTGDSSMLGIILLCMGLSMGGFFLMMGYKKKQ